jgi:hypothetical protein
VRDVIDYTDYLYRTIVGGMAFLLKIWIILADFTRIYCLIPPATSDYIYRLLNLIYGELERIISKGGTRAWAVKRMAISVVIFVVCN